MPTTVPSTPPPSPRPADPPTLAEQKSDFTAEGSPPPGKVANAAPVKAQITAVPEPTAAPEPAPRPPALPDPLPPTLPLPRRPRSAPRVSRARYP